MVPSVLPEISWGCYLESYLMTMHRISFTSCIAVEVILDSVSIYWTPARFTHWPLLDLSYFPPSLVLINKNIDTDSKLLKVWSVWVSSSLLKREDLVRWREQRSYFGGIIIATGLNRWGKAGWRESGMRGRQKLECDIHPVFEWQARFYVEKSIAKVWELHFSAECCRMGLRSSGEWLLGTQSHFTFIHYRPVILAVMQTLRARIASFTWAKQLCLPHGVS